MVKGKACLHDAARPAMILPQRPRFGVADCDPVPFPQVALKIRLIPPYDALRWACSFV
jgi:hypothetical protein